MARTYAVHIKGIMHITAADEETAFNIADDILLDGVPNDIDFDIEEVEEEYFFED